MTRWDNKIWKRNGGKPYTAPKFTPSQRHLRILNRLQEQGMVMPATADDVVCECTYCGKLCLGRDWYKHMLCYFKDCIRNGVEPECSLLRGLSNIEVKFLVCQDCKLKSNSKCPLFPKHVKEYLKINPKDWVHFKEYVGVTLPNDRDICQHCGVEIELVDTEQDVDYGYEPDDDGNVMEYAETVDHDIWKHIGEPDGTCRRGETGAFPTNPLQPVWRGHGNRTYYPPNSSTEVSPVIVGREGYGKTVAQEQFKESVHKEEVDGNGN